MSRPSFVWQTGSWSETHPDLAIRAGYMVFSEWGVRETQLHRYR